MTTASHPKIFCLFFLKNSSTPYSMFNIQIYMSNDEDMNMRILIELLTKNVKGIKDANFDYPVCIPIARIAQDR